MEEHPIYGFARHYNPKLTDSEIKAKYIDNGKYLETMELLRQDSYADLDPDEFLTRFHSKYPDLSKKKEPTISGVSSSAGSSYSWESGRPELAAKISVPNTSTSLTSGSSGKITPEAAAASKRAEQELALQKARQRPNFEKAADLDEYTKQQVQGSILAPEKEYQTRLNTLQSDSDNLQRAIEASEARIKEKWGENWMADYNARAQALNNPETRTEELAKKQQEFEADQFINERNQFITALEANHKAGIGLITNDKYHYARVLEEYDKERAQKAEHAGWGNLTLGILQRATGKLVGSVGEVMNIGENLVTQDKKYTAWDKIEDFFIDFQDQTAKVAPRPTKYTRPLYTKTAKTTLNGEKVEVDYVDDKPSVVRNSKGMVIDADPTKLGELKPKNQYNSKGLIYQTGEVLADAMVQIATTKGIGGTLVKTGMGAKAAYAVGVTASTMGQMAGGLYDQGLKMFDGDKRKAAQYATMTGLAIGVGSNLFGVEARLAGGPGVFDNLTMGQVVKGLTPKAAAARTTVNFLKEGAGEAFEETILEKGIEAASAMVLNGDAEDIDLNEMKGTALISFAVGALMGGAESDFKNSAWLVAAENPEEFKKALQAEVANGKKVDVEKMYQKALKIKGLSEIKEVREEDIPKLDELTDLKDKAEKAKAIGADAQAKVFKEQAEAKEVEIFKEYKEEIVIPEEAPEKEAPQQETTLENGGTIQWDVFGGEETGEWTVGEKTKTKGGRDAVVLSKVYVESSEDGKSYTKEYADANGIKYDNERTTEHIVALEDLEQAEAKEVEIFKESEEEIVIPEEDTEEEKPAGEASAPEIDETVADISPVEPIDQGSEAQVTTDLPAETAVANLDQEVISPSNLEQNVLEETATLLEKKDMNNASEVENELIETEIKPDVDTLIEAMIAYYENKGFSVKEIRPMVYEVEKEISKAKEHESVGPSDVNKLSESGTVYIEGDDVIADIREYNQYGGNYSASAGKLITYQYGEKIDVSKQPINEAYRKFKEVSGSPYTEDISDPVVENLPAETSDTDTNQDWTKSADTLSLADTLTDMEEASAGAEARMENEEGGDNFADQEKIYKELEARGVAPEDIPFLSRVSGVDPEGHVANALGVDEVTDEDFAEFDRRQKEVREKYSKTSGKTTEASKEERIVDGKPNTQMAAEAFNGSTDGIIFKNGFFGFKPKESFIRAVKKLWNYTFYRDGNLPEIASKLAQKRLGRIREQIKKADLSSERLRTMLKGKPEHRIRDINAALQNPNLGKAPLYYSDGTNIEEGILNELIEMRMHVDSLSSTLITEGISTGESAMTILGNLEFYLTQDLTVDFTQDWNKLNSYADAKLGRLDTKIEESEGAEQTEFKIEKLRVQAKKIQFHTANIEKAVREEEEKLRQAGKLPANQSPRRKDIGKAYETGVYKYSDGTDMEPGIIRDLKAMKELSNEIEKGIADLKILGALNMADMPMYLTRSYQVHWDKDWFDKVQKTEAFTNAVRFFREQKDKEKDDLIALVKFYREKLNSTDPGTGMVPSVDNDQGVTEAASEFFRAKLAKAELELSEIDMFDPVAEAKASLHQQTDKSGSFSSSASLGSSSAGAFAKRKLIPDEIRALWGESKDPAINYMTSVYKIAHILENRRFIREVVKQGEGKFLHPFPVGEFFAKFPTSADEMADYHSTPEIVEAFKIYNQSITQSDPTNVFHRAVDALTYASGVVKKNLTVLSIASAARNFFYNPFAMIQRGAWNPFSKNVGDAIKYFRKGTEKETLEFYRLGILGDDLISGPLADIRKDYQRRTGEPVLPGPLSKTWLPALADKMKTITRGMEFAYAFGDNFYKVIDFYRQRFDNKSDHYQRLYDKDDKAIAYKSSQA